MKYIQKWDKRQESLKMRAFREVKLPLPPKLAGTALTLSVNSDELESRAQALTLLELGDKREANDLSI